MTEFAKPKQQAAPCSQGGSRLEPDPEADIPPVSPPRTAAGRPAHPVKGPADRPTEELYVAPGLASAPR